MAIVKGRSGPFALFEGDSNAVTVMLPDPPMELKLKKSYSLRIVVRSKNGSNQCATHRVGPAPIWKVSSVRGQGVTPDNVFPKPGKFLQVTPFTVVLRVAWAASIETTPSPSTKPINTLI